MRGQLSNDHLVTLPHCARSAKILEYFHGKKNIAPSVPISREARKIFLGGIFHVKIFLAKPKLGPIILRCMTGGGGV